MSVKKAVKIIGLTAICVFSSIPLMSYGETLRLGMGDPLSSDQGAYATRFKELVEHYSDGELNINLYPNGALGDEVEMVQNTRLGALDMALVAINNVAPFSEQLGILTMPYIIKSTNDALKVTTGALGERWNTIAQEQVGVRILGWTYSNFRYLTNSKRPVLNLQDLQGLKVRVPQNKIMLASWKAWGANPIAMSWTETFTALQQGVVDGQDNPYIVNNTMKFYEVQKYLTEVHYLYALQPLLISKNKFNKMDTDKKDIIVRSALEAQQYAMLFQITEADKAKQNMIKNGVKVSILEDEDAWIKIAQEKVWPKYYDLIGGRDTFEEIMEQIEN